MLGAVVQDQSWGFGGAHPSSMGVPRRDDSARGRACVGVTYRITKRNGDQPEAIAVMRVGTSTAHFTDQALGVSG